MAPSPRTRPRAGARLTAVGLLAAVALGSGLLAAADTPGKAKAADRGDKMPSATVLDHDGKKVELAEAWSRRPAIIVFYRGDW